MAAPKQTEPEPEDQEDEAAFIGQDEVLAEVPEGENDDHPMEDDEDGVEGGEDGDDEVVSEDNSIQHFPAHEKSVFAVAAHPTQPLAASGGEDDLGYIWNVATGDEVVKLSGHIDSVGSVAWSFDGEMVATGGMDGRVRIWRRVGKSDWKNWEFLTELQGPNEVMWVKWHPKGNVLLAGSEDSTVWLWQLPSGNTMQVLAGHEASVECGEFTRDGKRILTGDGTGTLILWDPRNPNPLWKMTPNSARFGMHSGITSLAISLNSAIAVVGGAEGEVRVVSLAKGEVLGVLEGHKEGESVEAAAFVDWSNITSGAAATSGPGVAVTGATDGKVCVWDLTTMKLRSSFEHKDAITSLITHPSSTSQGHLITSSSSDKTSKTWDTRSGAVLREHKGHQGPVLGAAMGAFEDYVYLITAGDDGVCLVFDTKL